MLRLLIIVGSCLIACSSWAASLSRIGIVTPAPAPSSASLSYNQLFTSAITGVQGYSDLTPLANGLISWIWSTNNREADGNTPDPALGKAVKQTFYMTPLAWDYALDATKTPQWFLTNHPDWVAYQNPVTFTATLSSSSPQITAMSTDPEQSTSGGAFPFEAECTSGSPTPCPTTVPGSFITDTTHPGYIPAGTYIVSVDASGAGTGKVTLSNTPSGNATGDTLIAVTLATQFYSLADPVDQNFTPLVFKTPAVQTFILNGNSGGNVGSQLALGWAGISWDNVTVANEWQQAGHYTGVSPPCSSTAWPACGGSWVQDYTGTTWSGATATANNHDSVFANDFISWMQNAVAYIHTFGAYAVGNVTIADQLNTPLEAAAAQSFDIALIEAPTLDGGSGCIGGSPSPIFVSQTDMLAEFQTIVYGGANQPVTTPLLMTDDDACFPTVSTVFGSASTSQQQQEEFSLAWALILATPKSSYNIDGVTGPAGAGGHGDAPSFVTVDPLLSPNCGTISIGPTGGENLGSGLFSRTLTNCTAFANTTNGALNYTVPSGTWHDALSAASVSPGTYSLAADSGVVLFNH